MKTKSMVTEQAVGVQCRLNSPPCHEFICVPYTAQIQSLSPQMQFIVLQHISIKLPVSLLLNSSSLKKQFS